jgi:hypothetical protein
LDFFFMRLKTLASFLILFCAVSVSAQDAPCALKLAELPNAPELLGFHLGMTPAQVKTRVPQVEFGPPDDFGVAKTSINPDFDPRIDKASLSGVRTISLDFLDDRLTSLWLGYDNSFKWQTVPDFVKGMSQSLHLPEAWKTWKIRGQQIRCGDFQMTVSIVAEGPSFHITDETAAQTITARREAKEEADSAVEPGVEQAELIPVVADRQSKTYYADGCQPSQPIKAADLVAFKTKEEAEKAGYKLAKACE